LNFTKHIAISKTYYVDREYTNYSFQLGTVLKSVILATSEVEIGRMWFEANPYLKGHETPSQSMSGHGGVHRKAQIGGSQSRMA
jgi:hypothetical protein